MALSVVLPFMNRSLLYHHGDQRYASDALALKSGLENVESLWA